MKIRKKPPQCVLCRFNGTNGVVCETTNNLRSVIKATKNKHIQKVIVFISRTKQKKKTLWRWKRKHQGIIAIIINRFHFRYHSSAANFVKSLKSWSLHQHSVHLSYAHAHKLTINVTTNRLKLHSQQATLNMHNIKSWIIFMGQRQSIISISDVCVRTENQKRKETISLYIKYYTQSFRSFASQNVLERSLHSDVRLRVCSGAVKIV